MHTSSQSGGMPAKKAGCWRVCWWILHELWLVLAIYSQRLSAGYLDKQPKRATRYLNNNTTKMSLGSASLINRTRIIVVRIVPKPGICILPTNTDKKTTGAKANAPGKCHAMWQPRIPRNLHTIVVGVRECVRVCVRACTLKSNFFGYSLTSIFTYKTEL